MLKKILWVIVLLGVIAVFLLSWLPQPQLNYYWFMPAWLGKWTDNSKNGNIRTAVPFLLLGLVTAVLLAINKKPWFWWLLTWVLLVLVVVFAELGQLFLPMRKCDLGDIEWGGSGAAIGLLAVAILFKIMGRKKYYFS